MSSQAKILDGKAVSQGIYDWCEQKVKKIKEKSGMTPCLATVLVGQDPASVTYTQMKRKRCEAVGMKSMKVELPASITTQGLVEELKKLSEDAAVHGILLQHPVPRQVDERQAFEAIVKSKDVDGVTISSFGAMAFGLGDGKEVGGASGEKSGRVGGDGVGGFDSCTPGGIMRLLKAYQIPIAGKRAVVIGRSPILGKPMAMLLLGADATVTVCHSKTRDLAEIVKQGEIVVAAVGRAEFVKGQWIQDGAVVVDAGYNAGNVGDVEYAAAAQRASWITPVPGGVGPMTIATLIEQTVVAAARQLGCVEVLA